MHPTLTQLIRDAFADTVTDVFIIEGDAPRIRREGDVVVLDPVPVSRAAMEAFWQSCGIDPATHPEADLSWQLPEGGRLRVNLYHTLGRLAAVLRPIRARIPPLADLGLPAPLLESWLQRRYGLILVTGPTGSGKSTTVASCLDWINHHLARHIVTLEDPIEYLFENDLAFFSQREIRQDTESFASALRAALRQSPDVLFVGEIRDRETAVTALHAAETGHLVISTLHSSSVVETIDRFSHLLTAETSGALGLLATQLIGVISQQLLPRLGGGLFPALEYLQNEAATRRWILDHRLPELQDHLQKAADPNTCSLLDYLVAATRQGYVAAEVARSACPRAPDFDRAMRGISS
ncbi:MAG: ATPase, T2SS/T4P/T4SS family [Verrucomicrobia bacterium]|nr:ATPase, T2SS/T4P/T4SS family [Verrucomicrobiota bacterium]